MRRPRPWGYNDLNCPAGRIRTPLFGIGGPERFHSQLAICCRSRYLDQAKSTRETDFSDVLRFTKTQPARSRN